MGNVCIFLSPALDLDLISGSSLVNLTKTTYLVSDSVCIGTDADNWSEIHHAILHEAQELQGRYIFY